LSSADRPHKGWVRFLTVLIGFLTVLTILTAWVDRQVFDTQEWGDTSLKLLQNPDIQKQVATYAVDELYANVDVEAELKDILPSDLSGFSGIAAGGLRQVADSGAQQALSNPNIQDLWRQANETAQTTLVRIIEDEGAVVSTTGGKVELQLRPLIIEIAGQVGLGQQARDNIPADVGSIEIVDSEQLSTVQTVAKIIQGTALITALLLLALIGLTVYLARGYRWASLLWIAAALAIGAVIVLILRSVAEGIVVSQLANVDIQPAAEAAYSIGTDLLRSIAISVIWSAVFLVFLAWLVSPNGAAESARRFLAVPFGSYPGATFTLLGLVAFVFLLMGAGDQREFLIRLMIVILFGLGAWAFRRTLVAAYPDAHVPAISEFGQRAGDKAKGLWQDRPDFLRRKQKDDTAVAAAAPPPGSAPTPGGESPTEVLTAEGVAAAPAPDPETARLDRLERLAGMHERGVLTDEEFAEEKARVRGEGG
jgi:hypothetical protein